MTSPSPTRHVRERHQLRVARARGDARGGDTVPAIAVYAGRASTPRHRRAWTDSTAGVFIGSRPGTGNASLQAAHWQPPEQSLSRSVVDRDRCPHDGAAARPRGPSPACSSMRSSGTARAGARTGTRSGDRWVALTHAEVVERVAGHLARPAGARASAGGPRVDPLGEPPRVGDRRLRLPVRAAPPTCRSIPRCRRNRSSTSSRDSGAVAVFCLDRGAARQGARRSGPALPALRHVIVFDAAGARDGVHHASPTLEARGPRRGRDSIRGWRSEALAGRARTTWPRSSTPRAPPATPRASC